MDKPVKHSSYKKDGTGSFRQSVIYDTISKAF